MNSQGQAVSPDCVLSLNAPLRQVSGDENTVCLTATEFRILQYFLLHRRQTVSAQQMYEAIWGEQYLPASANTVTVHILHLRRKLESCSRRSDLIRTVWGKGYCMS